MIPLDKQILEQYIDACELIKDTKEEIREAEEAPQPDRAGQRYAIVA